MLNVGFCLWCDHVAQTPDMKRLVSEHRGFPHSSTILPRAWQVSACSHRGSKETVLPFSCQRIWMQILPSSIPVCLAKSKFFSHNFSFLSDNFSLWGKNRGNSYQMLLENDGHIGRKSYVIEIHPFSQALQLRCIGKVM